MKSFNQHLMESEQTKKPEKHNHDWIPITYNNGHKTYSLTDRCTICFKTRKVNPNNGRVQNR